MPRLMSWMPNCPCPPSWKASSSKKRARSPRSSPARSPWSSPARSPRSSPAGNRRWSPAPNPRSSPAGNPWWSPAPNPRSSPALNRRWSPAPSPRSSPAANPRSSLPRNRHPRPNFSWTKTATRYWTRRTIRSRCRPPKRSLPPNLRRNRLSSPDTSAMKTDCWC